MSHEIVVKPEIPPVFAPTPRDAAVKVIEVLNAAGTTGYFVGGCVRDEGLGLNVSDYDVTTSASPNQIKALFQTTSSESEQYGIIRVFIPDTHQKKEGLDFKRTGGYASGNWIETCTYRCTNGILPSADLPATLETDTYRRDFTVNALYLNPGTGEGIDLVGGRVDLQERRLRVIGDPVVRFREDPLRILRGIRLSISCSLTIDPHCLAGMREVGPLLADRTLITGLKLNQELNKVITKGITAEWYRVMTSLDLIRGTFPLMVGVSLETLERFDFYIEQLKEEGKDVAIGVSRKRRTRSDGSLILGLTVMTAQADLNDVVEWYRILGYSKFFLDEITLLRSNVDKIALSLSDEEHLAFSWMNSLDQLLVFYCVMTGDIEGKNRFVTEMKRVVTETKVNSQKKSRFLTGADLATMGYPRGSVYKMMLSKLSQKEDDGTIRSKEEACQWIRTQYPPSS